MLTLALVAGLLAFMVYHMERAPIGYEDGTGFHYGMQTLFPADAGNKQPTLESKEEAQLREEPRSAGENL